MSTDKSPDEPLGKSEKAEASLPTNEDAKTTTEGDNPIKEDTDENKKNEITAKDGLDDTKADAIKYDEGSNIDEIKAGTGEETPAKTEDRNSNQDDNGRNGSVSKAGNFNDKDAHVKKSTVNGLVIALVIAVGVAAFIAGAYTMNINQEDQITQEDLEEAIDKLELKILQQQLADRQQPQPAQPQVVRISADDDPIIGDPDAPITIIEFSDFQCPFCERFNSQTLPLLHEEYIDKGLVKLVFRDFPIQSIHPNAVITALAAECADDQNAFKEMHDILFEKQREWSNAASQDMLGVLVGYASEIGISEDEFETCVAMGRHVEDIRKDLEDGRAYGISGTPGFYIGNDEIGYVSVQGAQPFEIFKRVIDAQLGV